MLGDFPIMLIGQKKKILHIPRRVKDELKWLRKGAEKTDLVKSRKLERRCEQAYVTPPGLGFIGSKYVYKGLTELIGRSTFYSTDTQSFQYRIIKCSGIEFSGGQEKARFQDKLGKIYLNHDALQILGYSRIHP